MKASEVSVAKSVLSYSLVLNTISPAVFVLLVPAIKYNPALAAVVFPEIHGIAELAALHMDTDPTVWLAMSQVKELPVENVLTPPIVWLVLVVTGERFPACHTEFVPTLKSAPTKIPVLLTLATLPVVPPGLVVKIHPLPVVVVIVK